MVNIPPINDVSISSAVSAVGAPDVPIVSCAAVAPPVAVVFPAVVSVPGVPAVARVSALVTLRFWTSLLLLTCILLLVFLPVLTPLLFLALPAVTVTAVACAAVDVFLPLLFLSGLPAMACVSAVAALSFC
jgi:hypothetical protein